MNKGKTDELPEMFPQDLVRKEETEQAADGVPPRAVQGPREERAQDPARAQAPGVQARQGQEVAVVGPGPGATPATQAAPPKAAVDTDDRGVLAAKNLDAQYRLATVLAASGVLGEAYNGKPAAVVMAMNLAAEKGKNPFSYLHSSYEVKGRITEWGGGPLGAVLTSGLVKEFKVVYVSQEGKVIDEMDFKTPVWAVAAIGERTSPPVRAIRYFTAEDAVKAKLDKKDTYQQYHRRMYETKAVGALLKLVWPDVIEGIPMPEYDEHVPSSSNDSSAPTGGQLSAKEKLKRASQGSQAQEGTEEPAVSGVQENTGGSLPRENVRGNAERSSGQHDLDVSEASHGAAQPGVVQVPEQVPVRAARARKARVADRAAPVQN